MIDLEGSVYPEKWVETEDKKAYHKTEQQWTSFLKGEPKRNLNQEICLFMMVRCYRSSG